VSERHMERVLRSYVRHYNSHRSHQGLGQRVPGASGTPLQPMEREETTPSALTAPGPVRPRDRLGGLIHEYEGAV